MPVLGNVQGTVNVDVGIVHTCKMRLVGGTTGTPYIESP